MKKFFFALLLLPVLATAQPESGPDKTGSPYFFVPNTGGFQADPLPLKATSASVNIAGVIADVQVSQVYVNTGKVPIEAIYVFPGSTNAAVYGMSMVIGRRRITAKIAEKQKARQQYEEAKAEGKRASLLEQHRPNVFQMNVANIMPGDTVAVQLQYTELLVPKEGVYEFVYPTVVGPRYNSDPLATASASNFFARYPYQHAGEKPGYTFDLDIHLAGGMPLQNVSSPTHAIQVRQNGLNDADVLLDASETAGGNRDFILQYSLKGKKIESGLLLYEDGPDKFFLYMAQPPKRVQRDAIPPREYVFVVDVSGSMNGFPLDISKTLLRNLVTNLTPEDRFNVILFAGTSNILANASLPATGENIQKAIGFIDRQEGSGGTNLLPALERALTLPRNTEGLSRSIVVATDGYVTVEKESFDLIRNHLDEANLFSFGIGSSVNRYIIEGMARAGRSEPFVITEPEGAAAAAEMFRKYISSPVLTQIKADFDGFDVYDLEPISIPDILAERPVVVFGKWRGEAKGKVSIKGRSGSKRYSTGVDLKNIQPDPRNAALKYLWARERIKMLDDYNSAYPSDERVAEVTKLGLDYSLLTAYTSFVAIDTVIARPGETPLQSVKQPLPLPAGVSDLAVGFDLSLSGVTRHLKNALAPVSSTPNDTAIHENEVAPLRGLLVLVLLGLGALLAFRAWLRRNRG